MTLRRDRELSCLIFLFCSIWQRLDVTAIVHDHGADVIKGIRLSGIHSILCIDHELDLTVNAGIDCAEFGVLFTKASAIVTTVRNSLSLYRRLRDEQVSMFSLDVLIFMSSC